MIISFRFTWKLTGLLFSLLLGLVSAVNGGQGSNSALLERYFAGMRARGLYHLAEQYGSARLVESSSPEERRILSIEFARTLVEHGTLQSTSSRQELWDQAHQILQQAGFHAETAGARAQFDLWQVLLNAQEGITLAFQAELQPEKHQLQQQTLEQLRPVLRELKEWDAKLETTRFPEAEWPLIDRQQMRGRLQLVCGQVCLKLAALETNRAERTSLLQHAELILSKADRVKNSPEIAVQALIEQARCARGLNEFLRAEKFLDQAGTTHPDQPLQDMILAERLGLELARGKLDVAMQLAMDRFRKESTASDELRAEAVEVLLQAATLAESKGDSETARQIRTEAENQHRNTYGLWRLKTTLLLQRRKQDQELGHPLAEMVREALAAWESSDSDQAVEKYGEAARMALQAGLRNQAFDFAFTQASILIQQQKWARARDVLAEMLAEFPKHPRVAEASLMQCYVIGQLEPHSEHYRAALEKHQSQFSRSFTVGNALWMLALEAEHKQHFFDAINFYRQITDAHEVKTQADLRITLLLEQLLQQPDITPQQRSRIDALIESEVQRIARPLLTDSGTLSAVQCQILLQCVELCLQHRPSLMAEAQHLLPVVQKQISAEQQLAVQQQSPLDPAWNSLSRMGIQLRIILLASQGKMADARMVLQEMGRNNPEELLSILSNLTTLTSQLDLENVQELGTLQRMTVNELETQRAQLSPEQQRLLDRASLQASIAMKDWSGAIRTLEDLRKTSPRDKTLLHDLIEVLQKRGTPSDLQQMKTCWIELEQLEAKGSVPWLEARLQIAEIQFHTGDVAAAKKILGVTQALYPNMGTPSLKQQADALWKQLQ